MKIDIAKIDDKIRKLQALKDLASDPEMREMLAEVVERNGNGKAHGHFPVSCKKDPSSSSVGLTENVKKACLSASGGTFTVNSILKKVEDMGFPVTAKDKLVAVYGAMRRLRFAGFLEVVEEGSANKPAKWIVSNGHKQMKLDT